LIAAANLFAILFSCYEAYIARVISEEISEIKYIAGSVLSVAQVAGLGIPIMFLVKEIPSVSFFVRAGLIFIIGMSILLMIFVPKMYEVSKQKGNVMRRSLRMIKSELALQQYSTTSYDAPPTSSNPMQNGNGLAHLPTVDEVPVLSPVAVSPTLPDSIPVCKKTARILRQILEKHGIDVDKELEEISDDDSDSGGKSK
jgi:hypothetical protein